MTIPRFDDAAEAESAAPAGKRDARPDVDESEELIAEGDEVETILVVEDDAARMCPISGLLRQPATVSTVFVLSG